MPSRKSLARWLIGLTGFLVLLLTAVLLITPKLLSTDWGRLKVQGIVAAQTGGRINYEQVSLVFLPRLALQVEQLEFELPDIISTGVEQLLVSPDLSALMSGHIAVAHVRLGQPKVRLNTPPSDAPTSAVPETLTDLWPHLQPLLLPLSTHAPELEVEVSEAAFELARNNVTMLTLDNLESSLAMVADPTSLEVALSGSSPELALHLDGSSISIAISSLKTTANLHQEQLGLSLEQLQLAQPELMLSGTLTLSEIEPKVRLTFDGVIPDLAAIRSTLLPLQDQIPGSQMYFTHDLGGSLEGISLQTEASTLSGLFNSEKLTLQASLENGSFSLPQLQHPVTGVSGSVNAGNRRIELLDAHVQSASSQVSMEKGSISRTDSSSPFMLVIEQARLQLDLEELHDDLNRLPALKDSLADISDISGRLDCSLKRLAGPLHDISGWTFNAIGSMNQTKISTRHFPNSLNIESVSFQAQENRFAFSDLQLQGLDAALTVSGAVRGKLDGPTRVDTSLSGSIGEQFSLWLAAKTGLPDSFALNTPVTIRNATLTWEPGNKIDSDSTIKIGNGPVLSTDFSYSPPKKISATLTLQDAASKAKLSFINSKNNINIGFSGTLHQKSINDIFIAEKRTGGSIAGDFVLNVERGETLGINTTGQLKGQNLLLPVGLDAPLAIETFAISGLDKTVAIENLRLALAEERVAVKGSVANEKGAAQINLDLHTGPLDVLALKSQIDSIHAKFSGNQSGEQSTNAGADTSNRRLPFTGRVGLLIDTLSLKHLEIAPVRAEVQLDPQKIVARVTEASLCGVELLPSGQVVPGEIQLSLPIEARDQDLSETSICLTGEQSKITGTYDLTGNFSTRGTLGELLNAAQGDIVFNARDGAIEQSPFISSLLSVVNLTEFYRGDYLTLDKSKLGYKTLLAEGQLAGGRMNLPTIHFNGTTLEIIAQGHIDLRPVNLDIDVLIAPLKTVDTVVKWIPGVNYLLAGNLVTIPVRVTGPIEDIAIRPTPVEAVGKGVLGIAERILKLPVKIAEPLTGFDPDAEEDDVQGPEEP